MGLEIDLPLLVLGGVSRHGRLGGTAALPHHPGGQGKRLFIRHLRNGACSFRVPRTKIWRLQY